MSVTISQHNIMVLFFQNITLCWLQHSSVFNNATGMCHLKAFNYNSFWQYYIYIYIYTHTYIYIYKVARARTRTHTHQIFGLTSSSRTNKRTQYSFEYETMYKAEKPNYSTSYNIFPSFTHDLVHNDGPVDVKCKTSHTLHETLIAKDLTLP
jgi:hypothetical protein